MMKGVRLAEPRRVRTPGRNSPSPDGTQIEGVSRKALDEARAELEERIASKSIAGGAHIVARNGSPE
jgi:hypothetical protein